jgi:hypothetical protein
MPAISATLAAVKRGAPRLTAGEARLLAYAVDNGTPVGIEYVSSTGSTTSRIIDELQLHHGARSKPGAGCATINAGSP